MTDIEIGITRTLGTAGRDLVHAAVVAHKSGTVTEVTQDGCRIAAVVPRGPVAAVPQGVGTKESGPFCLSPGANFAEQTEVDGNSDLAAAVAIAEAIEGRKPLIIAVGARIAVDLLADDDGDIDGYRILARLPGMSFWLASEILRVGDIAGTAESASGLDVTMAVLQSAIATGNQLVVDYQRSQVRETT